MTPYKLFTTPRDAVPLEDGQVVVLKHGWELSVRQFCLLHSARLEGDNSRALSLVAVPPLPQRALTPEEASLVVTAFGSNRPGNPREEERWTEPDAFGNTYRIGAPAAEGTPLEEYDYSRLFARLTATYGFPPTPWEDLPRFQLDWYTENLPAVQAEEALARYNAGVAASGNLKPESLKSLLESWSRELKQ